MKRNLLKLLFGFLILLSSNNINCQDTPNTKESLQQKKTLTERQNRLNKNTLDNYQKMYVEEKIEPLKKNFSALQEEVFKLRRIADELMASLPETKEEQTKIIKEVIKIKCEIVPKIEKKILEIRTKKAKKEIDFFKSKRYKELLKKSLELKLEYLDVKHKLKELGD